MAKAKTVKKAKAVKKDKRTWHNLYLPEETFAAIEALSGLLAAEDPLGEPPAKCRTVAIALREATARRQRPDLIPAIAGNDIEKGDAVAYAGEEDGLPVVVRAAGPKQARRRRTPT